VGFGIVFNMGLICLPTDLTNRPPSAIERPGLQGNERASRKRCGGAFISSPGDGDHTQQQAAERHDHRG
jgi:hypothetical protein